MAKDHFETYWRKHAFRLTLPFDLYERYRFASELTISIGGKNILEVGAGEGIIRRFLTVPNYNIITIDLSQGDVKGSGVNLPFKDGSFDIVMTIDALEHIPNTLRSMFVQELLRVSKSHVIVAGPFTAPNVRKVEYELNLFYKTYDEGSHWLEEHIKYGLPDLGSLKYVGESVKMFSSMPLKRFQFTARLKTIARKLPASSFIQSLINLLYNLLFYRRDVSNPKNNYRTFVVIRKTGALSL